MKHILPIVAFFFVVLTCHGLTHFQKITQPKACPDSLEIVVKPSQRSDQLYTVKILYRPYEPEVYRGRQKAFAFLKLTENKAVEAQIPLRVTKNDKGYQCRFDLHPNQFAEAQLTLSTQLYEKDGHPTVGGGEILEVELTHFLTSTAQEDSRQ